MSFEEGLRRIAREHAPGVPEIALRLARGGFDRAALSGDFDTARVPLLRKSDVPALQAADPPWGGMLADNFHPEACFMSPGGVVEPLVPRMVERLAGLLKAAGFDRTHTVLNGFNYHFTPAGLLFHAALVRIGCTVLPAGPQNIATQAEFAHLLGANAFVGIASHLKILFEHRPSLPIRLAMAGAEPHAQSLRESIVDEHGARCCDMYGFAEGGIVAASCAQAGALHFADDVIAELCEPGAEHRVKIEDETTGELVISLNNPGFPMLRFATGDLVRILHKVCVCGRVGILQVLGRADPSVRVKGMLLHDSQLRRFMAASGSDACRLEVSRVDGRDRIGVSLRLSPNNAPNTSTATSTTLDEAFREACRLRADTLVIDESLVPDSCTIVDVRGANP